MAVTINYNNNTVTIDGVSYGILDIPDDIWVEMDWDYRIPIMFMQMDHYLEQERLEEERRAALRKQEWMIRFAGMMTAKLKQQKEDEDKEDKAGKGKGERGELTKAAIELPSPPVQQLKEQAEVEEWPQKSLNEKQQEYQDLLIRCIAQPLGFSKGRPVAACIIYKCLRHWRSFEVERASIFDRIIQTIGQAIETQDDNKTLAYWLSNASTLLFLLQRTLKASAAAGMTPQHRRSPSTLFGRMTRSFRGIPLGSDLSSVNGEVTGGVDTIRLQRN
nr:PREDICTED: myosin-9-like [Daucus carota subsp. sativus]